MLLLSAIRLFGSLELHRKAFLTGSRIVGKIGLLSTSVYLSHMHVLRVAYMVIKTTKLEYTFYDPIIFIIVLCLCLVFAIVYYYFVEVRFTKLFNKIFDCIFVMTLNNV